ncbi:MAG: histidine kinase [Clostridiales bacterium]|nr:MAG: histidine kinase [Clostridiales bacterium]
MPEVLKLKKSNCKNCYKCIRHCPVKSIRFSGNQAHIVENECILCGQCFVVCPQNAKEIADSTERVKVMLQDASPVIASIAPSFAANYGGVGIAGMRDALKALGFYDAEETAIGAAIVKTEYERILDEGSNDILISSCCHSVNLLIQKHFPSVLPFLADIMSPMQAHSLDIKRRIPDAKVVFIGPCVAKKDEADKYSDIVDAVLTFEELSRMFKENGIVLEKKPDVTEKSKTRLFPTAGGILKSMSLDNSNYTYIAIDGTENCIAALKDIEEGKLHKCFIEMSACSGSCIGGPVMEKQHKSPVKGYIDINAYAGKEDFEFTMPSPEKLVKPMPAIKQEAAMPSEQEIFAVLRQMGKTKPELELNCGSCGYNTCREKAIAVCQGKAEISMCLPFLMERAENFSDYIINNTPNGILVVNENFEVQQINKSAMKIMNISKESDVLGEPVIRILDPKVFVDVSSSGKNVYDQRVYLAEYKRYVDQTILYDKDFHITICMMKDVTDEEELRAKKESMRTQTVEIADKVVDKQMRIVQEIASLLGETAAETKIALTKLKESIKDE